MPVVHVVLFKAKANVTDEDEHLSAWIKAGEAMAGQIPGCRSVKLGKGLAVTLHRGQGYTHGLVAILDKAEDLSVYAAHPAHQALLKLLPPLFEDTKICVDFESPEL